ncbi:hypothetical protein Pvag_1219 [Pantoea vagans C9-1]|nr:hypothetical protein Pvag_1219 [Pantoea vagans C9-1]
MPGLAWCPSAFPCTTPVFAFFLFITERYADSTKTPSSALK